MKFNDVLKWFESVYWDILYENGVYKVCQKCVLLVEKGENFLSFWTCWGHSEA